MQYIDKIKREKLIELLKLWHHICEDKKMRYWVCGGTFLGAIREKGMIEWDYDVDICVMDSDYERMWDVFSELKRYNIGIELKHMDYDGLIKIAPAGEKLTTCVLDIFIMRRRDGDKKRIESISKFSRNRWPKWFMTRKELFPLKKYDFEGYKVWGPRTDAILKRHYGDYMKPVYHEHSDGYYDIDSKDWLKEKKIPVGEDGKLIHEETIIEH